MQQAALLDEIVVPFGVPKMMKKSIAPIWGGTDSAPGLGMFGFVHSEPVAGDQSLSRIAQLDQRTTSRTNVCSRRKRTCGSQGASPGLDPKLTLGRDNSTDSLSIKYKSPGRCWA